MKHCSGCDSEKPLDAFYPLKSGKLGRAYYCRVCAKAKRREHYTANAEVQRVISAERMRQRRVVDPEFRARDMARASAWAKANTEAVNKRNRKWRAANPERAAAHGAKWRKANPDKAREHVETRRARKENAPVNDFSTVDWHAVLEEFNHSCGYCLLRGVPLQQEHMTPLSRNGEHSRANIIPACGPCNNRKGTRDLLDFLGMRSAV